MKTIRIRNIPDATHQALKIRAIQMGMSMEQYVLKLIEEALKNKGGEK
jgi:plasmid stability protein